MVGGENLDCGKNLDCGDSNNVMKNSTVKIPDVYEHKNLNLYRDEQQYKKDPKRNSYPKLITRGGGVYGNLVRGSVLVTWIRGLFIIIYGFDVPVPVPVFWYTVVANVVML
jgi:hypothetical protein